jgi:2-amino-4-hydroxy-6-hydroxymethyldihydropteridine diphosphokinase
MQTCYILLGSNLGDREGNLQAAREQINSRIAQIIKVSSLYQTEAWGFETSDIFLNQVIEAKTALDPDMLLDQLLSLETLLGRKRDGNRFYTSRLIDLDILFYENMILSKNGLVIPHPLLHKRRFVLTPLNEIAPDWAHPVLHKTISELLHECDDQNKVQLFSTTNIKSAH